LPIGTMPEFEAHDATINMQTIDNILFIGSNYSKHTQRVAISVFS